MKKYYVDYGCENTSFAIRTAEEIVQWLNYGDYDNIDDAIQQTAESKLIYFDDQWEMMKAYQRPDEADYNEAYCMFLNELYGIVKEEDDEEDEKNEEDEEDVD